MAALPSYVKVLAEGYKKRRASAVQRTEMEDGMVKQLKTKSRVLVTRSVTLNLASSANYQSFIAWFQNDINYGADWFDFVDPEDGVTRQARFVSALDEETPIFGVGQWRIQASIETWSG